MSHNSKVMECPFLEAVVGNVVMDRLVKVSVVSYVVLDEQLCP